MKAIGLVAHHDDHVLFMAGAIERLVSLGWDLTLVAFCVPKSDRQNYFYDCCRLWGANGICYEFEDCYNVDPFSVNKKAEMIGSLARDIDRDFYDVMFTHSNDYRGEYWNGHTNHVEVRSVAVEALERKVINSEMSRIVSFSFYTIYGLGTPPCAKVNSKYFLPLTYQEQLNKLRMVMRAPDAMTNLKHLSYPCPNPEAFDSEDRLLPADFTLKR